MSTEAEATDILVRLTTEGGQYFLRFTGAAAQRSLALFFAGIRAVSGAAHNRHRTGGRMNARDFMRYYAASSTFTVSKDQLSMLDPELKRLRIPYFIFKPTKNTKNSDFVELAVRKEDEGRFLRICEKIGIGSVEQYDSTMTEITEEEYDELQQDSSSESININVTENGETTISAAENPTQAPTDPLNQSEQNLDESELFEFDDSKSVTENFDEVMRIIDKDARLQQYENGELIPISANKEKLLFKEDEQSVTVVIPKTDRKELMVIPKDDVLIMDADGGKSIHIDLDSNREYQIIDALENPIRKEKGKDISSKWNTRSFTKHKPQTKHKTKPKIPTPTAIKGGA